MRPWTFLALALLACPAAQADDQPATTQPAPYKTGDFDITFTQRSPLSAYPELVKRLNLPPDKAGKDYDLSKEPFKVHIPQAPDAAPFGLMVYVENDGVRTIAPQIEPILDAHHLIVIGITRQHVQPLPEAGLCLDAVYNLGRQYPIDPNRIYLFGAYEPVGWATDDVFTADAYIWWIGYYKKISTIDPIFSPAPSPQMLRFAKQRPQVLAFRQKAGQEWYQQTIISAMTNDGFDHVINDVMKDDDYLQPAWFEKTLAMLESGHPLAAKPTTHPAIASPTTSPAPSDAAHLLNLAQNYIDAGLTDRAREKLNLLIQQYPDDPAATKARDLLTQMQGQ